jgi:hypothetical protein
MNQGKILIRYLGDGAGDKNLPVLDFISEAKIDNYQNKDSCVIFEMYYPNFPFNGKVIFNLISTRSENERLYILTHNILKIENNEFIVTASFYYLIDNDTENFEIIGRFQGEVPNDLCYSVCPSLIEMVT